MRRLTTNGAINRIDVVIALAFMLYSLWFFWGRLQYGYPVMNLTTDASAITSFAAARKYPDLFEGDPFLGDLSNFRHYSTIHIPLTEALEDLTHNFALAFTILLAPVPFIQLLGYYIFGRVLFGSRFWGLMLALFTYPYIRLNMGEFWGIFLDALPRVTFQAALPYVLALAIVWRNQYRRWPWIMAASGALVYLHPVSGLAWTGAIWLGLGLRLPTEWTWRRRIIYMVIIGAVAALVALPFASSFLGAHEPLQTPNYEAVWETMLSRFPPGMLDPARAYGDFFNIVVAQLMMPIAVLGIWFLLREYKEDRSKLYTVLMWTGVVLVTSVVLPPIEQTLARALRILPPEVELIRSVRYFYPLGFTFALWAVAEIARRTPLPSMQTFIRIGLAFAALSWVVTHWIYLGDIPTFDVADFPTLAVRCLQRGDLVCPSGSDAVEFAQAVKEITPPRAKILPSDGERQELRFYALRPLVYNDKDGVYLAYTNHEELLTWRDHRDRLDEINQIRDLRERLPALIAFAEELQADYLATNFVMPFDLVPDTVSIAFANNSGMLLEIRPGEASNPPNPPLF